MKTHVITLDNSDDYISINDKLIWAKSPRVLLVWPDENRLRLFLSDLILILRKGEEVGSQIAIVSDDPRVIDLGHQLNLSVFSSIPEAQKKAWRRPKKTRRLLLRELRQKKTLEQLNQISTQRELLSRQLPTGIRLILFLIAIIAVGLLIGLFIPSAEIQISPKIVEKSIFITVWTNPEIKTVNLSGAVPLRAVPVIVDGTMIKESTGIEKLPTQSAKGEVIFRNLTDSEIMIPSGTIVRTSQGDIVRYSTTKSVTLAAGVNQAIIVPIVALVSGVKGNVNPEVINAVEGEVGGSVAVSNQSAVSGGVDSKMIVPSFEDYQQARIELLNELSQKAVSVFNQEYANDVFLIFDDEIVVDEILSEKQNPEIGTPADQFQLSIEARFLVNYISRNDIDLITRGTFETIIIPGYEGLSNSLFFSQDGTINYDDSGNLRIGILANQKYIEKVDENKIKLSIIGKSIISAQDLLNSEFSEVKLIIKPELYDRIPFFTFRIEVNTDESNW